MSLELVENKDKKPFAKMIAGGFFIFTFFILIYLTYSFEFKQNKSINSGSVKQEIIENYFKESGVSGLSIEYIERDKYSIIRFNEKTDKTINDYLQAPFLLSKENCYAKRYAGNNDSVIIKNINLEKLFLNYKYLTGQNVTEFLGNEVLTNNFSPKQEKNLTAIFNSSNDGIINIKSDGVDYLIKAKITNKDRLKEKLDNFEKTISQFIASFHPETQELVLPDDTTVREIVIQPEKFIFENYNNNTRYIKDENLNFELAYRLEDSQILFSNNIEGLSKIIPEFESCSSEGVAIIPKYLIENIGILKDKEFDEFREFIFIENQGKTSLILK